jgi:hypothetical protein
MLTPALALLYSSDATALFEKAVEMSTADSPAIKSSDTVQLEQHWPWEDWIRSVIATAPAFAFAFVVGYFYAFDIAWFAFFGLSEHIVFALRALPVAIGASMLFAIALRFSGPRSHLNIASSGWLSRLLRLPWLAWLPRLVRFRWLAWLLKLVRLPWITIILCIAWLWGASLAALSNHFGLAAVFALMVVATCIHYAKPMSSLAAGNVIYWAATMMMLSLAAGYITAIAWKIDKAISLPPLARSMMITLSNSQHDKQLVGHVIFAGNSQVLLYEYACHQVRLLKIKDIKEIAECQMPNSSANAADRRPPLCPIGCSSTSTSTNATIEDRGTPEKPNL